MDHAENKSPETGRGSSPGTRLELARFALLGDKTPHEKLAVVADGDPLGLYQVGTDRVRSRSLFLAPDRVHEESVYQAVILSDTLTREEDLVLWLRARVDEAIDRILYRDWEALRTERIQSEVVGESAQYLSSCFNFEPMTAFRAAARFNSLAERARRSYVALFLEGKTVVECLESGLGPLEELREFARLAAEVVLSEVHAAQFDCGAGGTMGADHV